MTSENISLYVLGTTPTLRISNRIDQVEIEHWPTISSLLHVDTVPILPTQYVKDVMSVMYTGQHLEYWTGEFYRILCLHQIGLQSVVWAPRKYRDIRISMYRAPAAAKRPLWRVHLSWFTRMGQQPPLSGEELVHISDVIQSRKDNIQPHPLGAFMSRLMIWWRDGALLSDKPFNIPKVSMGPILYWAPYNYFLPTKKKKPKHRGKI